MLTIDPIFSNWVNFNKKCQFYQKRVICSRNSKSFKGIFFVFEIYKLKFFQKKVSRVFFSVHFRSLTLFQLSVGYGLNNSLYLAVQL